MKALKIFLSVLLLFAFTTSIKAQRGARIGYIDMEYILENVPEYQEAKNQLASKVQVEARHGQNASRNWATQIEPE